MTITISPIALEDIASYRACLDAVAREHRYLALLEAPSAEETERFVGGNLLNKVPQLVARDGEHVVGWCDILPGWPQTRHHCGSLGIGVLPAYRGRGLGQRLLEACLALAKEAGITRVQLEVRSDNEAALRLYRRLGFHLEGTKQRSLLVEGQYKDTVAMALLL